MGYKNIIVERKAHIAVLTLNRPDKLNAMNPEMNEELKPAIEDIISDDDVRVVVITGAGRGFSAGADIETQHSRIAGEPRKISRRQLLNPLGGWEFFIPLSKMDKISIAAVNGVAYGVGLSLALSCDIRIASENARFSSGYVRMGLTPGGGHTFLLPRIVGMAKAIEMMCIGEIVDATEAERIGLVSKVVPADELMASANALAKKFADGASVSIELIKRLAYMGLENDLERQVYLESYAQRICFQSEDHAEAVKAFFEKRPPVFKGL
jgi:2-(1,2-epoxy-1,2-dihydrophenyl)acetyl-CoA isomerase